MAKIGVKIGIGVLIIVIGTIVTGYATYEMNMNGETATLAAVNVKEIRQVSHSLGSTDAPIKIIEFGDYQCPFCGEWLQETSPTLKEKFINSGKVELIFVDYPFLGPDSYPTAHASFCAEEQDKYWQFHETVYISQGNTNDGWANAENIRSIVQNLDIDINQFDQCMSSNGYNQKIDANLLIGENHNVNQTPTFLVLNKDGEYQKIEGKQPIVVFEEIINELS